MLYITAVNVEHNQMYYDFFGTQFKFQIMFNAFVHITGLFFKAYHMELIYIKKLAFGENKVEWTIWKSDQIFSRNVSNLLLNHLFLPLF
jgi:hypothetical protein